MAKKLIHTAIAITTIAFSTAAYAQDDKACTGLSLKIDPAIEDRMSGETVFEYIISNIGAQSCTLSGYPTVALLDPKGTPVEEIAIVPLEEDKNAATPATITMTPGTTASFFVAFPLPAQQNEQCADAVEISITLPDTEMPFHFPGSFTSCEGSASVSALHKIELPAAQ